ncbi:hypothetical protein AAFN85_25480 [Mucilaginibacter sp. CAU 1740]|jgi:AcrR family transcriptional regulator|uniref:hypothetical protein n=1 Tax=Mucilaginibacter sp. CAU 1740 TaxID=3140365 RepID=UPI00325ACAF5
MEKHHGQIVEYRVRKNAYCISDLARACHINRRSIYNWFNSKRLKEEIILRIGLAIKHDFSHEFPEFFKNDDFSAIHQIQDAKTIYAGYDHNEHWKDKYLHLLQEYNDLILKDSYYL